MKRVFEVAFQPTVYFQLSPGEVETLMLCAKIHYDGTCRAIASPGPGAFLYGASMDDGRFSVSARQLDTLCKIVEMPPPRCQDVAKDLALFLHYMLKIAKDITPELRGELQYEKGNKISGP